MQQKSTINFSFTVSNEYIFVKTKSGEQSVLYSPLLLNLMNSKVIAMPFSIIHQDITKMHCDAVVNAANRTLLGGDGVDAAIHRAAGPKLYAKCLLMGGCSVGHAKATPGYRMDCQYIIHTVGPRWRGGKHAEREHLTLCYYNSLQLAEKLNCRSIAFPLISAGVFHYPREEAIEVACSAIEGYLKEHDMEVYLCLYPD